jgi:L-alanine-DL-glutamate epimerase-like enolase superfamily enzyme
VPKSTDIRVIETELYILPVKLRVPLKFGNQVVTAVKCARVRVKVRDQNGSEAEGWGETPLSVAWVWPSELDYAEREGRLIDFCRACGRALQEFDATGHPLEIGTDLIADILPQLKSGHDTLHRGKDPLPYLAALVAFSPYDIALYDAFGNLHGKSVFSLLGREFLSRDLGSYLEPAAIFSGKYPADYLVQGIKQLPVWHLVGGLDAIKSSELAGNEPDDGYPVLLRDWIRSDGLNCLKIKLSGTDFDWDCRRLEDIGVIAVEEGVDWLSADFNCTVTEPDYVNAVLDRLKIESALSYERLLYVEQPFPYDLAANRIDVHSVSGRKPLFMDESAHDWTYVRMGKSLGWTGVALKTCKTLSGALLSLCWAKQHGMGLMVQDLTNPMLAQLSHVQLAAHAGTIMGVESNSMQFYPQESLPEAKVHPGLFSRKGGLLDLTTLGETGFGYRVDEISRELPSQEL